MKKIFIIIFIFILKIEYSFAVSQSDIRPEANGVVNINLSRVFSWLKWQVVPIITVFIIWALIYMWIRLVTALWNPEKLKKVWLHLIYLIVWVFVIFASIWIVTLIANLWANISR